MICPECEKEQERKEPYDIYNAIRKKGSYYCPKHRNAELNDSDAHD